MIDVCYLHSYRCNSAHGELLAPLSIFLPFISDRVWQARLASHLHVPRTVPLYVPDN